jgi:hypothetical protein
MSWPRGCRLLATSGLPFEAYKHMPTDGAARHDFYLYGKCEMTAETAIRLIATWINELPASAVDTLTDIVAERQHDDEQSLKVATALLAELEAE